MAKSNAMQNMAISPVLPNYDLTTTQAIFFFPA